MQICKYSLNLWKCDDRSYCGPLRAPDAFKLLSLNNGFLPPVIQGQDKHFLNLLHTLEYFGDQLSSDDKHCPSISPELYQELVCKKCGKYFPTKAFIKMHVKTMHRGKRAQVIQDEQSTIPTGNRDALKESADYEKEP